MQWISYLFFILWFFFFLLMLKSKTTNNLFWIEVLKYIILLVKSVQPPLQDWLSWYVYDLPVLLLTIKFWSPIMIDSISDFRWEALTSKVADVPLHQTPIYQTWKLVHRWQVHDAKIFLSNWSYNTVLQLLPHAH